MSTRFVMTPATYGAGQAAAGLRDVVRRVARFHAVHISRRDLADLDPRLLADIGITAREALTEAGRAPWDVGPVRRGGGNGRSTSSGHTGGKLAALGTSFRSALRRWRTRQRISDLDQHALRDIGVTYAEAEREANKAFWQR